MSARIVILGGGTGGTLAANRLRRHFPPGEVSITVIDQDNQHVYQPGLLFVPFGLAHPDEIVRPRKRQLHRDIDFIESEIDRVDIDDRRVVLADEREVAYDVLIVATGAMLALDETEGLTGEGWENTVFTFYDVAGAAALHEALQHFDGGRLVINVVDMPIKCPVAPLEFCFLADWYFTEREMRDRVDITYVTPLDAAFTKPVAAHKLGEMLADKGVTLVTEFNTGEVRSSADGPGALVGYDGREVPFDLAVVVPLHSGAAYVGRSPGLGDELNFIPTNPTTLQSTVRPEIFAIGDATNVAVSKAGSVTHFEGEVLTENVIRFIAGKPLDASYDGHANCFIETGFGKALLIDFNTATEPLEGHFPGAVGLPLLQESRLNHLAKLLFQTVYWHGLLPGRDLPLVHAAMPTAGKHRPDSQPLASEGVFP
jgi:sulfide:quinone oxidoreductase